MADSKITALTALTAADPVNDMFPVVDVSDTSMAASGTTKRISANNILSSSPTASGALTVTGLVTAGSATITGAATVGTTLGVTGVSTFAAGSQSLPALTTTGDTNTGIYYPAADTVAVTTGGVERLKVDSTGNINVTSGNVVMATSGKGIDFSATTPDGSGTVGNEILNDYEEGTFTPTFTASAGTPTTVTLNSAAYTKIGRRVSVDVDFTITAIGTASGNLYLTLPFSQSTASTPCGAFVEVSVVGYMGAIFQIDATRAGLNFYNNATTWVNGYRYRGTYTYNV